MKKIFLFSLIILFFYTQHTSLSFAKSGIKFSSPKWAASAKKEINGRTGPGFRHPIKYVYKTPFLPFKLLASKDGWYQVQDFEGEKSWILGLLLTTKADVFLVTNICPFYKKENDKKHYAMIDRGALLRVRKCSGKRCLGFIRSYEGWFEPASCGWGATPGLGS